MVTRWLNPPGVTQTALVLSLSMLFPLMSSPPVSLAAVGTNITPSALPLCSSCGLESGPTTVSPPVPLAPPLPGNTYNITGGARPGNGPNLFHSFGRFDVGVGDIANFQNTLDINGAFPATTNILSRVTGGSPSQIYGMIRTTDFGSANLFLMNPAGVLIGATAVLDLGAVSGSATGGSFYATTADYLKLVDGNRFYAIGVDSAQTIGLWVAPVAAFGFTAPNPVSITLEGSSLVVGQGKTLAFIGGNAPFRKLFLKPPLWNRSPQESPSPAAACRRLVAKSSWRASRRLRKHHPLRFPSRTSP